MRAPHLALLLALLTGFAHGAEPKGGPVYLSPENADDDFQLQGEYRGWQAPRGSIRSIESVALQVIARGDGKFEAVKYYGGLPGAGWRREDPKYDLQGERAGEVLQLAGREYDVVVDGERAVILTHEGERIGELQKVERVSPTLGAAPPPGAIVLFNGESTDHFDKGKIAEEGWLMAGADTKDAWSDFRLHGEFRLPYKPKGKGQDRGNSGFYLQSRYELQVLDSFGLEGVENECGAIYKTRRPDVNMCLPPLAWQTYDIDFKAARFDKNGKKIRDMQITVWHNGVVIHDRVFIPNKTGAGKPEGPEPLPIRFQDHGNPVVYRNLWIIDMSKPPSAAAEPWVSVPIKAAPLPVNYPPPFPVPPRPAVIPLEYFGGPRW